MTAPDASHVEPHCSVAQWVAATEAEGPGLRFAIWFQGCPLRCPGCCNPEMLPIRGGRVLPVREVIESLRESKGRNGIEGLTLLGGEPIAQPTAAAALAQEGRRLNLSVMVFSGFLLEEIRQISDPAVGVLLAHTDILVDGPYRREEPESRRRWVGSANQRVHFLTDRHRQEEVCWQRPNTLEIRLREGQLTVNGFPAPGAVGLWKRLR